MTRAVVRQAVDAIRAAAEPLPAFDDDAFGALFDRFADARVVLLGEASHGTSEFYRARDAITRRLVSAHGFNIVAVEADYGKLALTSGFALCEQAVLEALRELLASHLEYAGGDGAEFLDAAHNARLVRNAEAYYRAMYLGSAESWNLRDTHMFETLDLLLATGGDDARAVVWAHNSHIGDARHTEMGTARGELNIGQLCRERFGDKAVLVGFGTHAGTVAAASDWDAPMEIKRVRPSLPESYERLCHDAGIDRALLDLREGAHPGLRDALSPSRLERFIGVIYLPETERWSHYAEASLPRQFDAWVWFDETQEVGALPTTLRPGMPETYPFGL